VKSAFPGVFFLSNGTDIFTALNPTLDPGWSSDYPHDDTQISKYIFFVTHLIQSLSPLQHRHSLFSVTQSAWRRTVPRWPSVI
jgi:hypothetical protein